jgi:tRNA(Ile)-lysidine synthase
MDYLTMIIPSSILDIPCEDFVVAVSGGSDSLCLSLLSKEFAMNCNLTMQAVFVDHQLRKESSLEIAPIIALFDNLGIPHKTLVWKHENLSGNIEKRAREARYSLLTAFCKEVGVKLLLVAHHNLDQWETFFMRLSKGSGLSGLCAMRNLTVNNGIKICRPLLKYSKLDILDTLYNKFKIISWVNDPMNMDNNYERVRWRSSYDLLSQNYRLNIDNIGKSINRLQRADECLSIIARKCTYDSFDGSDLNIEVFKQFHDEIKSRVLLNIIENFTGKSNRVISYSLLSVTCKKLCAPDFKALNIVGCLFKISKNKNISIKIENRKIKK